jgi:hypothetical protein
MPKQSKQQLQPMKQPSAPAKQQLVAKRPQRKKKRARAKPAGVLHPFLCNSPLRLPSGGSGKTVAIINKAGESFTLAGGNRALIYCIPTPNNFHLRWNNKDIISANAISPNEFYRANTLIGEMQRFRILGLSMEILNVTQQLQRGGQIVIGRLPSNIECSPQTTTASGKPGFEGVYIEPVNVSFDYLQYSEGFRIFPADCPVACSSLRTSELSTQFFPVVPSTAQYDATVGRTMCPIVIGKAGNIITDDSLIYGGTTGETNTLGADSNVFPIVAQIIAPPQDQQYLVRTTVMIEYLPEPGSMSMNLALPTLPYNRNVLTQMSTVHGDGILWNYHPTEPLTRSTLGARVPTSNLPRLLR